MSQNLPTDLRITILTRKYPPITGGMETFSYQLSTQFAPAPTVIAIPAKQPRDIVWIAPRLLWRAWRARHHTDIYHLHDLVLAPLARPLRALTGKPIVVTVHGLELTYNSAVLRHLINWSLPAITHCVAVSDYTAGLLQKRGVPSDRISVITHGVDQPLQLADEQGRAALRTKYELPDNSLVLLMVGRLVPRKGAVWFVDNILRRIVGNANILPGLNPQLFISSNGPELSRLHQLLASDPQLNQHARLLGIVPDDTLQLLYNGSDIFVAPNRPLPHDAEGFGFVSLEAASHGLPVLASNVEGIPSAIHNGKNGWLLPPDDADAWVDALRQWAQNPAERQQFGKQAAHYTATHFTWAERAKAYNALFTHIINQSSL